MNQDNESPTTIPWDTCRAQEWDSADSAQGRTFILLPQEHFAAAKQFLLGLRDSGESILLRDRVATALETFIAEGGRTGDAAAKSLRKAFGGCQEIYLAPVNIYALIRPRIGQKRFVRLHPDSDHFEEVSRYSFLRAKDAYIQGTERANQAGLVLDFRPFFRNYPKVRDPKFMGEGISVLNRHLAGTMHQDAARFRQALAEFLANFQLDGFNMLCNDHLATAGTLVSELENALDFLSERAGETPYAELSHDLRVMGFEPGWGATASQIRERLGALGQVLDSADPEYLEKLLGKLPLIRKVLMVSPHGWFAQHNVLGKPDTGGQVTYVLDQARALERSMQERFDACGVEAKPHVVILTRLIPEADDTTCNMPREQVAGGENCWIIRVPFRHADGTPHATWVSRFHLWPYLERYALESKHAVLAEFLSKPDLVVGHYSDGNLVAHRLAADLGVTHCAAVHALEKTKYLLSDLYWTDMEPEYHFSCQFTADIIAYNAADFIISSSYREIGGTATEMGMFESYETFSMPGLYRATSGMDSTLARYNIVPPGASEEHFYPAAESDRRIASVTHRLEDTLFSREPKEGDFGVLTHPEHPPILAMSRMDKVKNLPGLVEAYAKDAELRRTANLIIMSSLTRAEDSSDQEEIDQINRLYALIDQYQLQGSFRWCASRLDKVATGEIYRVMADRGGVFVQPALMETFGLTVIEAMACGLPVVVTCFGGPAEIVNDRDSGEHVDPNNHEQVSAALRRVLEDHALWEKYRDNGIQRVRTAFNWKAHADKVLRLANTYSFWDYFDAVNRQALDQYLHTLYHTVYRPRAMAVLDGQ